MRRRTQAIALVLAACAAVAGGGWQALLSPGPVHEAHADLAADCDQCHLVFDGVPDGKCLACHEELATRAREGRGWHATVATAPCIDCHTDHVGAAGPITEAEALEAFDHEATGFSIAGAHARVECGACHGGPLAELNAVCIECHAEEDPHGSALGPDCDACHVAAGWALDLPTREAHAVDLHGGHAALGCEDCHATGAHLEPTVPCADCHREAHGGTTSPCEDCHTVEAWAPAGFNHGPCTCTFAGVHQTAACLDCHPGFTFTDTPVRCSGCHQDALTHEPLGECSRCHEATTWRENTFDHDRAAFPVAGQHLEVDCAGCHAMDGTFRGAPTACEGCHAEAGEVAHGGFGPCVDCHDVDGDGFRPATFDHAARAGFPLDGRHADLSCPACHAALVPALPETGP